MILIQLCGLSWVNIHCTFLSGYIALSHSLWITQSMDHDIGLALKSLNQHVSDEFSYEKQ